MRVVEVHRNASAIAGAFRYLGNILNNEGLSLSMISLSPKHPNMQRVFEALASSVRRQILAYLSHAELNAGEIAARFDMSKASISQHLSILEAAGLVEGERRGQFIFYRQMPDSLINALHGFAQEACPTSRPLKRESAVLAKRAGPSN